MALLKQEILVLVFVCGCCFLFVLSCLFLCLFVCLFHLYNNEILSLISLQYPYPTTPEHASQHKVVSGIEVEFPSNLSPSAVSILQGVCRFVLTEGILATSKFTFYVEGNLKIVVY